MDEIIDRNYTINKVKKDQIICPHGGICFIKPFNYDEKCNGCPDYWKNYNKQVYDYLLLAEQNPDSNLHRLKNKFERDGGKVIDFDCGMEVRGILVALCASIEDYYWVVLNSFRNLRFITCCAKYDVLESERIPSDLSVLLYMQEHNKKDLLEMAKTRIDDRKYDKLITDIVI